MELVNDYLDRFVRFMDNRPAGEWQDIATISIEPERLTNSIKYLIDFENKPYVFNHDYTKVKREEYIKLLRNPGNDREPLQGGSVDSIGDEEEGDKDE